MPSSRGSEDSLRAMLFDAMPDADLPQWLDEVDVNTLAVLTLDDGERMTAEVLEFDDDRRELIVDVVSSNRPVPNNGQHRRAVPVDRVVSFEGLPSAVRPWPLSDPCRRSSFSLSRFVSLATLFLGAIVGSLPLFFLLMKRPYGFQQASAIVYTLCVAFGTFAATGRLRSYLFTCPAVQTQVPRLLWLHLGFLAALFTLQTAALAAGPNLPDWWNTEHFRYRPRGSPFEKALLVLCFGLGYAQVFANRSLLDRAHRKFTA